MERNQLERIEAAILRIDRKLTALLQESKKETWVPTAIVKEMTGWDSNKLTRYRAKGLIKARKNGNSISYLLESINPIFINNPKYKSKDPVKRK